MRKNIITLFLILSFLPLTACSRSSDVLYDIHMSYDGDRTLDCSMTVECNISGDLYFNLYGNAYRQGALFSPFDEEGGCETSIEDYGHMDILSVYNGNKPLFFEVGGSDKNVLRVKNDEKGKSKITVNYTLCLPVCSHRLCKGEDTVNLCNFYPILAAFERGEAYFTDYYKYGDPFYSEVANYRVSLKLPSTYSVASSMDCIKTEIDGESTEYSYSRNAVRDVAFILSEKFNVAVKKENGVEIRYYYYQDDEAENSLGVAVNALGFYSDKFGKYPYSSYVICQADFVYGGMEYPCLTYISDEIYGEEKNYCIAHETAHQWWYGLVGVNEVENGCIDEGLTEFSAALFSSEFYGKNLSEYIDGAINVYNSVKRAFDDMKLTFNESMDRPLSDYYSESEYVALAYCKGMLTFYEVYKALGEKEFYKRAKRLVKKYGYKNIGYAELKEVFGKNGGEIIEKYRLGREETV